MLCPCASDAQINFWGKIFTGEGECLGVNPINSNTIYAQSTTNVLYVSHNGGGTWDSLSAISNETRQILVLPNDTSILLIAAEPGNLMRSTDGGATWTTVLSPYQIDGESIDYDPVHPDTLYAVDFATGSVYRSLDAGATWTFRGSTASPQSNISCTLTVRPDSSNIVYAGSGGGRISKTTDGGLTWRVVKSSTAAEVPKIVVNPVHPMIAYATVFGIESDSVGVWKTTDGGEHWTMTSLQFISSWSLAMDYLHPDTLYTGTFSSEVTGIYRTTDAGLTWTFFNNGFAQGNSIWNLKIDRQNPSNVYAGVTTGSFGNDGIFKLTQANAGMTGVLRDSLTLNPVSYGTIFVDSTNFPFQVNANGNFILYRAITDNAHPNYAIVWTNGYVAKRQHVAFVNDSIVSQDILIPRGFIRGTIYNDLNDNGVRDSGEPGVKNWPMQLIGPVSANVLTDSAGNYFFGDLVDGSYELTVLRKAGWSLTSSGSSSFDFNVGQFQKGITGQTYGEHQLNPNGFVTQFSPSANSIASSLSPLISATFADAVDSTSVNDTLSWIVRGSLSGRHRGAFTYSRNDSVITFHPTVPFLYGEEIICDITQNLKDKSGSNLNFYLFSFSAPTKPSNPVFSNRRDYPTGSSPYSVAAADFNGDGWVDLAEVNYVSNSVWIFLNNKDGTFTKTASYSTLSEPGSIAIADVNNDGHPDLLIGCQGISFMQIFLNHGDGTFAQPNNLSAGGPTLAISTADLYGDGAEDIVQSSGSSALLRIFRNDSSGSFQSPAYASTYAVGSAIADFNSDGILDIASSSPGSSIGVVITNNLGAGDFLETYNYQTVDLPYGIASLDFTGDGLPDIVVADAYLHSVSVYANNGSGAFPNRTDYPMIGTP
ncbi:MAG TPA: FG-GAP-like repeat-containing protein, partial [Bacteroidota bacterium]|nr:FG-GAP-like repeat-containing protein [Bacteroidota bacterium]